jgi:hypothetical protein
VTSEVEPSRVRARSFLVVESLLIIVSVALGFALAQFGEARADRQLAERALISLMDEIERNLATLQPLVPVHEEWVAALANPTTANDAMTAVDVLFATRPPLPAGTETPFPSLRQSAWDAAVSGDALRLIDYDVSTVLSEIYRLQEQVGNNVERLADGALSAAASYDPEQRAPSIRLLWLTVADILAAERGLMAQYQEHLPTIRDAVSSF